MYLMVTRLLGNTYGFFCAKLHMYFTLIYTAERYDNINKSTLSLNVECT